MPILTGWKSISKFCDVNKKTAKKWVKKYHLPVVRIGSTITASSESITLWHDEIRKKSPISEKPLKQSLNLPQKDSKFIPP